jgi:hypothetical protein
MEMKHLQIFEDFKSGPMEKPKGFLSKMAQGAKHALGFENNDDRKSVESLYRVLTSSYQFDWSKGIREIKPGVIVGWVNDDSVTVDKNTPEIIYKGKSLDLHNIQDEADFLYDKLLRLQKGR